MATVTVTVSGVILCFPSLVEVFHTCPTLLLSSSHNVPALWFAFFQLSFLCQTI